MARPGRPPLEKPELSKWVDSFIEMLLTERGAALNTRQAYWRDLADYSVWLRDEQGKEVEKATTSDIKAYLKELAQRSHTKARSLEILPTVQLHVVYQHCASSIVL